MMPQWILNRTMIANKMREREILENIEEIGIHDDVEDGYVQAQEDNNPELDDLT